MPQSRHSRTGEPQGRHGHPNAASPGHAAIESFRLNGLEAEVKYSPNYLKVVWSNGSEVTIRSASRVIEARVEHLHFPVDVVTLTLNVRMDTPETMVSKLTIVICFAAGLDADVHRLADTMNAERVGGDSALAPGRSHGEPPPGEPLSPPQLPVVRIMANLAAWADDPQWIGLYPPQETIRLIAVPSPEPASEAGRSPHT
jgi:hypothetical protein